jgi:villin 1/advillin
VDDGKEKSLPVCEQTVFNVYLKLSERKVKSAEEAGNDETEEAVNRGALTLYQCSDEEGTYKVTEIKSGPLEKSDLKSEVSLRVLN